METLPTVAGGVAPGSVPRPTPGPLAPGTIDAATLARREKWKAKAKLAYQRRKARLAGQPLPDSPPDPGMVGGNAGDPVAPTDGGPTSGLGPVPWTADLVRPFFDTVIPEVEKLTVERVVAVAQRIGDAALVSEVRKDAPWNPVAKATVIAQGPQQTADLMNSLGVDAKHAGVVMLGSAVASIVVGHTRLMAKLEELAKRHAPPPPPPKPDPAP